MNNKSEQKRLHFRWTNEKHSCAHTNLNIEVVIAKKSFKQLRCNLCSVVYVEQDTKL